MRINFIGIMCNHKLPNNRFECDNFNITVSLNKLPMVVYENYVNLAQYDSKPCLERDDDKLFNLECELFDSFDDFLKEYLNKQFVRTEYYIVEY